MLSLESFTSDKISKLFTNLVPFRVARLPDDAGTYVHLDPVWLPVWASQI